MHWSASQNPKQQQISQITLSVTLHWLALAGTPSAMQGQHASVHLENLIAQRIAAEKSDTQKPDTQKNYIQKPDTQKKLQPKNLTAKLGRTKSHLGIPCMLCCIRLDSIMNYWTESASIVTAYVIQKLENKEGGKTRNQSHVRSFTLEKLTHVYVSKLQKNKKKKKQSFHIAILAMQVAHHL